MTAEGCSGPILSWNILSSCHRQCTTSPGRAGRPPARPRRSRGRTGREHGRDGRRPGCGSRSGRGRGRTAPRRRRPGRRASSRRRGWHARRSARSRWRRGRPDWRPLRIGTRLLPSRGVIRWPSNSSGYEAPARSRQVAMTSMTWPGWVVMPTGFGLQPRRPVGDQRGADAPLVLGGLEEPQGGVGDVGPVGADAGIGRLGAGQRASRFVAAVVGDRLALAGLARRGRSPESRAPRGWRRCRRGPGSACCRAPPSPSAWRRSGRVPWSTRSIIAAWQAIARASQAASGFSSQERSGWNRSLSGAVSRSSRPMSS